MLLKNTGDITGKKVSIHDLQWWKTLFLSDRTESKSLYKKNWFYFLFVWGRQNHLKIENWLLPFLFCWPLRLFFSQKELYQSPWNCHLPRIGCPSWDRKFRQLLCYFIFCFDLEQLLLCCVCQMFSIRFFFLF